MGIQINGNTDTISAIDGGLTVSGADIGSASASNLNISGIVTASGGIIVAAGSTAAPSISPSGDSNTGIFFPSPDTVAIGKGGAEALRVDTSGRLGVGTNLPTYSLDVLALPSAAVARFRGNQSTTNNTQIRFYGANAATDQWAIGNAVATNDATRNFDIFDIVSNANRLRIDSTGNVQIPNGNLVFSTAGTGIDFSAGINTTTMTSELLADYEEGTWTPVDADGDAYTTNKLSTYTRVGRLVWAMCDVSATSTANGSKIGGLPFTAFGQSGTSFAGNYPCFNGYTSGPDARMNGHINSGTTQITLFVGSTETSLTNGQRIIITALYLA